VTAARAFAQQHDGCCEAKNLLLNRRFREILLLNEHPVAGSWLLKAGSARELAEAVLGGRSSIVTTNGAMIRSMRIKVTAIAGLLVLGLAGCAVPSNSPAQNEPSGAPTPTIAASAGAAPPSSIVISAQHLTVTDSSGIAHHYPYERWSADLVPLSTKLLGSAPRSSHSVGDNQTPPTTTYLWGGLFLMHSDWPADKSGVERLTVYAQGAADGSVSISTPEGIRFGDSAASVAAYPIFCNVNKKCFENQQTSSGASTTLRVLDSSGSGTDAHLVLAYVDATEGVTDIITTDPSWGTSFGIDVRD
jgi:hypothetical protein